MVTFAPLSRSFRTAISPSLFCRPYICNGSGSSSTSYGGLKDTYQLDFTVSK